MKTIAQSDMSRFSNALEDAIRSVSILRDIVCKIGGYSVSIIAIDNGLTVNAFYEKLGKDLPEVFLHESLDGKGFVNEFTLDIGGISI